MMALQFGQGAHRVRESERIGEAGESERALQTLNTVSFHERPIGNLLVQ